MYDQVTGIFGRQLVQKYEHLTDWLTLTDFRVF